eukprot:jgi/Psemu1/328122/estExt_fgenesh1_pg.C_10170003
MQFLKKVAARTTDTLERGMQGLAVRMDQGKNADLVRVAIYDPASNELLGVTESLPVPGNQESQSSAGLDATEGTGRDVRFEVPLWIPGSRRHQSLLLKVWIQSGASLVLQKANKNYLLGSAIVHCQALSEGVTAVALSTTALPPSPVPTPGPPPRLQLCILPDPKFSPIFTRGWSLTDPDMSGYSSTLNYLPLDQSYVFPGKAIQSLAPVTAMAAKACDKSLAHAQSVARILRNNRHDHRDPHNKATCTLGVLGVIPSNANAHKSISAANISVAWRRPDSMFEFEIAANESIPIVRPSGPTPGGFATVKKVFHPKLCAAQNGDHILPGILQSYGGRMPPCGFFLGGIYFCVAVRTDSSSDTSIVAQGNPFNDAFSAASATGIMEAGGGRDTGATSVELWETVLALEAYVKKSTADTGRNGKKQISTIQVPLRKGSEDVGYLLLQLEVTLPDTQQPPGIGAGNSNSNYNATLPATDGLVSLMGMDGLSDGVKPYLDDLPPSAEAQAQTPSVRHQQLNTMGYFFTTDYMDRHLSLRQSACECFKDRARSYKHALSQPEKNAPPHTLRTPKNFRPSSSRMTTLLSGIPFNCHIASLNINVMDATRPRQTTTASNGATVGPEYPGASFHNVTCGAPADHARGFGNVLTNVSQRNMSGGLRRLEAQRRDCSDQLQSAQTALIQGVLQYLTEARKKGPCNHVPSRHAEIQQLRWRVFECVHILHHVTWMCAVRRANVFSQSLGLAVSSFLASLSDKSKCAAGWPAIWARHGFLVCFEGLLSAAGKELGMIEDASVAIAMLRMVDMVLVPDNGQGLPAEAVQIPASPYLKWTKITPTGGEGSARRFVLQIGIDQAYYAERVPPPLQNNAGVRLYPILFEVGVDIRQWGANTGSNLLRRDGSGMNSGTTSSQSSTGGIVDDGDEDDAGIVHDDVLVALNYEAMRKMNCYAHALAPQQVPPEQVLVAMDKIFADSLSNSTSSLNQSFSSAGKDPLPVHPSLADLYKHILSSAGKMNHSILDEAATIAQQFGGGGLVFCKSGKDRTAMHLTYKQCQFAGRYRGNSDQNAILRDARLLRLHGTRLPICEKNVGQALYAFNSLQVKFMPEALKPPMDCLAGFLKGGEIFKGGGIES